MQTQSAVSDNLYNTNGLPPFTPPSTTAEARERIAQLNVAIMSIQDQVEYREMTQSLDPEWFKKATTSKRFKTLEVQRLQAWIDESARGNGPTLNDAIVSLLKGEYAPDDWDGVVQDAQRSMENGTND
jgi:hypothetical protein